jgi:hypothetical protein
MKEERFDEVDLNYILAAVTHHKIRVMKMEVNVGGDGEFRKEYIRHLTIIEDKILSSMDDI